MYIKKYLNTRYLYVQLETWFGATIGAPGAASEQRGAGVTDAFDHLRMAADPALREAFTAACIRDFDVLSEALLARDTAEIRRQAHRIKGAALLAEARNIAELAAQLERLPAQEALDFTATALRRMRQQLTRT